MDADWTTTPSARRVLQHQGDARPAWLWSADGQHLLWHNEAAELFLAKLKKHGLKRAPMAVPIKGQVARIIRMGSSTRTSLARVQLIAGEKPASATCAATPLPWQDGQVALLLVGVDSIEQDILDWARTAASAPAAGAVAEEAEADSAEAVVAEPGAQEADGAESFAPDDASAETSVPVEAAPLADASGAADRIVHEPEILPEAEPVASPWAPVDSDGSPELDNLAQFSQGEAVADDLAAFDDDHRADAVVDAPAPAEPLPVAEDDPDDWAEPVVAPPPEENISDQPVEADAGEPTEDDRLTRLFDRLATDDALFTPLTEADDALRPVSPEAAVEPEVAPQEAAGDQFEVPPASIEQVLSEITERPAPGSELVERTSRYNFDELSRILNDRVGEGRGSNVVAERPQQGGALINLGGETLVLNRLPLGILVFRDQQVLFANRAITEMIGYESVESLRAAGLASVFPAAGSEGQEAGPVNHLVQQDGTLVPVTARLQSISWQGRPALMLSASTTEVRTGHEAAVRGFAQGFAELRGDGFLEATRAGVISAINERGVTLLAGTGQAVQGKPLTALVAGSDGAALREFLERPARFAETQRPNLTLRSAGGTAELNLFAQGQAGVVTGYFGFVRPLATVAPPARLAAPTDADPALLARISRGVRRPLNTIIGFSDLIRSAAFGAIENQRYEGYANDIAAAGQEISALVDELDDYARLRDGRYLPQRASVDLTALLESCVIRIRQQANGARVIVRNAISENLPRVTADRASLGQAVLNLLASAIDQTPTGSAVVISAQREDDGGIAIHVRDSSNHAVDMAERFVVFRDGVGRDGQAMAPLRSSVGLALTRSLLAVNTVSLSVDPAGEMGMLFSLRIPADLVESEQTGKPTA